MTEFRHFVDRLKHVLTENTRGSEVACYSVALIGFTIAVRRVRPFKVFQRPKDVPNRFLENRTELTGIVNRVEPNGSLLVKHKPLIRIPGLNASELPVRISEVNVSTLGVSWLQTIVVGNAIKFVPVVKNTDYVQCEVVLPQTAADKKLRKINVGETLVSIGFASLVQKPLKTDKEHLRYYNKLLRAEQYALKKKLGLRYYISPTVEILTFVGQKTGSLFKNISRRVVSRVPKVAIT